MRRRQCERQTAGNQQGFHNAAQDLPPYLLVEQRRSMNALKEHSCDRMSAAITSERTLRSALDSRAINWQ
jgi:hypothetical protein